MGGAAADRGRAALRAAAMAHALAKAVEESQGLEPIAPASPTKAAGPTAVKSVLLPNAIMIWLLGMWLRQPITLWPSQWLVCSPSHLSWSGVPPDTLQCSGASVADMDSNELRACVGEPIDDISDDCDWGDVADKSSEATEDVGELSA